MIPTIPAMIPTTFANRLGLAADIEAGSPNSLRKRHPRALKRAKWALGALLAGMILAGIFGILSVVQVGPCEREYESRMSAMNLKRAAAASMPHKLSSLPPPDLPPVENATTLPADVTTELGFSHLDKRYFRLLKDILTYPMRLITPLINSEVWKPGSTGIGKPGASDISWGMIQRRGLHWPGSNNPFYFSLFKSTACGPLDSLLGTCGMDWSFNDGPHMEPIPQDE